MVVHAYNSRTLEARRFKKKNDKQHKKYLVASFGFMKINNKVSSPLLCYLAFTDPAQAISKMGSGRRVTVELCL